MRYYLQILGMGSSLTTPSAFVFFDSSRYLFNCGDCIQRVANEHKVRLSKLSDLFITSLSPDTIGSLPGMMLSIMDLDSSTRRRIHGPPGLSAFLDAACTFTWNSQFDIIEYTYTDLVRHPYTLTTSHTFQDENMKMTVIPMVSTHQAMPLGDNSRFFPVARDSGCVYIMECVGSPPRFIKEKAMKLGIPPGPMYGKLLKGETVVFKGVTVTPEQVTEPADPQNVVVFMDFKDPRQCREITEKLRAYLDERYDLVMFVHFTKKDVVMSQEYLEMLLAFPKTQNLVFDLQLANTHPIFRKSEELLVQLNKIIPSVFPLPFNPQPEQNLSLLELSQNVIPNLWVPNYLTKFVICPLSGRGVDRSEEINALNHQQIRDRTSEEMPLLKSLSCTYSSLVDLSVAGSDPQLLFLGTASMKPGSHRNVSGIHFSEWGGGLLLDCGEGSYSQLMRAYGEALPAVLIDLKAVLISHLHADHHLGIIKVLAERAKLTNEPTIVVAPELYRIYLGTCEQTMGPLNFVFQSLHQIQIPGIEVKAVAVDHKIEAYGFVISHLSGWKLVYSGDTRPSPPLIQEGYRATVLIHEATLDDCLIEHAIMKFHSTLGEALQVAAAMEVWKIVLTHFSQRYSKIPESTKVDAVYAFDLMKFKFSDCTELVSCMPSMLKQWKDDET